MSVSLSTLLTILLLGWQLLSCHGHGIIHASKDLSGHTRNHTRSLHHYLFNSTDRPGNAPLSSDQSAPYAYQGFPSHPVPVTRPPTTTYDYCTSWQHICKPAAADTVLNFVRVGLKRIGDAFIESDEAEKLYLDENDISEISSNAFTSLTRLQLLSLCKNQIPTGKLLRFSSHPTLQTLILNDNRNNNHSSVEKILDRLPRLEQLSLKRNHISHFGVDLTNFAPSLTHLDLSGNSIEDLDFLDNVPERLTHLHLNDNHIVQLKNNGLKNVRVLSVSGNRMKQLCSRQCAKSFLSLEGMERLITLNLSRNNIHEITEDAFWDTKRLTDLDLSHNRIKSLPSDVPNLLTMLENLHLNHNLLGTVPNICSLHHLYHLDLSYNNIAAVTAADLCDPSDNVHIKTLLMAGNRLTEVDNGAFINLWHLEKLDLSNNLIVNLPIGLITGARSLKILSLRNNTIDNIDRLFSARSGELEELHLQENPFCAVKHSNSSRLVIHLKDMPLDEPYHEEEDRDNVEENTVEDEDEFLDNYN